VDALLCSAANLHGAATLMTVMTGMGKDGPRGAGALKSRVGFVTVQDESTSAVPSLPPAVFQARLAHVILPLRRLIPEMLARLAALSEKIKPESQYNSMAMVKL
jgi:two-component system chemotaxis response regulator CheB